MLHDHITAREPASILRALDAGWDPDARSEDGWTPLYAVVSTATRYGADPLPEDTILTLVDKMIPRCRLDDVSEGGGTALEAACRLKLWRVADTLVRAGASVRVTDRYGLTPLHHAALFGAPLGLVKLFVEKGADPHAQTTAAWEHYEVRRGTTPAALAKREKRKELFAFLDALVAGPPAPIDVRPFSARWLRGEAPPPDLVACLSLEVTGDPAFSALDVATLATDAPTPMDLFLERNEGAARAALEALAPKLDWIASDGDGCFYAYFRHAEGISVAEAPVVILDGDAQLRTVGRTFAEALVSTTSAPRAKKLIAALEAQGTTVAPPEVKKALKSLPDIAKLQRSLEVQRR